MYFSRIFLLMNIHIYYASIIWLNTVGLMHVQTKLESRDALSYTAPKIYSFESHILILLFTSESCFNVIEGLYVFGTILIIKPPYCKWLILHQNLYLKVAGFYLQPQYSGLSLLSSFNIIFFIFHLHICVCDFSKFQISSIH